MIRTPVLARCLIVDKRDCLRGRNGICSKRISTFILVLIFIGSLFLVYFGMLGYIPEIFCAVGLAMFGLTTPAILYLWCAASDGIVLRYLIHGTLHACQVVTGRARKRAPTRHLISYQNPIPVMDDPIHPTPVVLEESVKVVEKTDESQSDETAVENFPQAEVEASITWLAQAELKSSSREKVRQEQSLPMGSTMARKEQRAPGGHATSSIPGAISAPLAYEPIWQTRHPRSKKNPGNLVLQESPEQGPYSGVEKLQVPKIPDTKQTKLNNPVEKIGLHVLLDQETVVRDQFSLVSQKLPGPGSNGSVRQQHASQDRRKCLEKHECDQNLKCIR